MWSVTCTEALDVIELIVNSAYPEGLEGSRGVTA